MFWLAGNSLITLADIFRIAIVKTFNDWADSINRFSYYANSRARGLNIRCVRTLGN